MYYMRTKIKQTGLNRRMKPAVAVCLLGVMAFLIPVADTAAQTDTREGSGFRQTELFRSGEDGYNTYRIPAIVTTKDGTLLAFCEGRKDHGGDAGDIDILVKRSEDGGETWSAQQLIWDDGPNTCGNPCPVVDEETGDIFLLMTHNLGKDHESDIIKGTAESTRTVWVAKSSDDGRSWTKPRNITSTTKKKEWGWYATGPGVGVQIKHGPYKGRLVIPCDHSYDDPKGNVRGGPYEYGAHAIYSDDHGETWKLGEPIRPKVNECQVVELADGNGTLLMNMRSYFNRGFRTHATSFDGGITWTAPEDAPPLVEPVCQAAILRYSWPSAGPDPNRRWSRKADRRGQKSVLLFLNPASTSKRHNMAIRASFDEGKTWPVIQTLYTGPSAYSSLGKLPDGTIVCLYEAGEKRPYERIIFQKLDPNDLLK